MPSSIPYVEIQLRRRLIFGNHPGLVEGPLFHAKPVRQKGADAKKDGRRRHHEGLPEFPTFAGVSTEFPLG